MKGLDGLAFVWAALMLGVGLFAESAGEPAITAMTVIGGAGLVSALYGVWASIRIVMNFADDMGLRRGLPYAALWILRGASAFWLWMSLTFWLLAQFDRDWHDLLIRVALMSLAVAVIIFAVGLVWFVSYAWAKARAHASTS